MTEAPFYLAEVGIGERPGYVFPIMGGKLIPDTTTKIKSGKYTLILGGRLEGDVVQPVEVVENEQEPMDFGDDLSGEQRLAGLITQDGRVFYDPQLYGTMNTDQLTRHVQKLPPDIRKAVIR